MCFMHIYILILFSGLYSFIFIPLTYSMSWLLPKSKVKPRIPKMMYECTNFFPTEQTTNTLLAVCK